MQVKKGRERVCTSCNTVIFTASKSEVCLKCAKQQRQNLMHECDRHLLESMYSNVVFDGKDKHGKFNWRFVHSCGTEQTWVMGNIKKQLKLRPNSVPCSKCGGKERMSKAMEAFMAKYGLTEEDVKHWELYRIKVRRLTDVCYRQYQTEINPLDLKRSTHDWHLDHKKSIIQCFLDGDTPEVAACKENLQMLPAFENLSKGRKNPT
jgi:hypothetical protein